jgi:hypothetical protein
VQRVDLDCKLNVSPRPERERVQWLEAEPRPGVGWAFEESSVLTSGPRLHPTPAADATMRIARRMNGRERVFTSKSGFTCPTQHCY